MADMEDVVDEEIINIHSKSETTANKTCLQINVVLK